MFTSHQLGLGLIRDRDARAQRRTSLSRAEIGKLDHLNGTERYSYLLRQICDHQEVWSIFDPNGMVAVESNPERSPVFPHEQLAGDWLIQAAIRESESVPIPLDDFIDIVLPKMADRNCHLEVSPSNATPNALLVSPDEFLFDLLGTWEQERSMPLSLNADVNAEFVQWGKRILDNRQRARIANLPAPKLP